MAFSDWRLARTSPETDPGVLSSNLGSYICKAKHDQSVTIIISENFPNRARTEFVTWDLSNCCTTGKLRNLNSGKPANPVCSRVDRSAPICAGMGVGRPGLKLAERRAIWRPGVASRAAVGARRGRSPGCRRGWGGGFSGF